MLRRVLITGVDGFTGRHLAASLADDPEIIVLGTGRRTATTAPVADYRRCDITDATAVRELIEWAEPDVVYHLAALLGHASSADLEAVNVGGFENLRGPLQSLARRRTVRMLIVGSAAEIGNVPPDRLPVDETVDCRPVTAYGRSKHSLVRSALAEPVDSGLYILVARTFNLLGAGLADHLKLGVFATALRAVARGETDTVRCGWLDTHRDYLDVGDAVRAYRMLVDRGPPGEVVNVCSGSSIQTGHLLTRLLHVAGLKATIVAAAAPRVDEITEIRGSHAKLSALTGWSPRVPLDVSLSALYGKQ